LYCEQLHQIRFQIEPLFNTIEKQNIKKKKTVGIQLNFLSGPCYEIPQAQQLQLSHVITNSFLYSLCLTCETLLECLMVVSLFLHFSPWLYFVQQFCHTVWWWRVEIEEKLDLGMEELFKSSKFEQVSWLLGQILVGMYVWEQNIQL
jgi:hypothetical protein